MEKGSDRKLAVGVIGVGRIGKLHAGHLVHRIPRARIVAVSDVRPEAARACAAELGIPAAAADPRALLDNREIQAVVICSSTDTHARLIEEAAAAGKHIFCEKPIALDLAQIDRALASVQKAKVKLQIGFNRRFDPNFARVRELVRTGRIGEPHILRITSRDPGPPPIEYVRVSGGIFMDMMIHDFDMARYLIGDEVEEVYAVGGVRVDPAIGKAGDLDTAVVTLKFRGGVFGTIDNSRRAVYGYDQRVEVFGSKGCATAANDTPSTVVVSGEQGVQGDKPLYFFLERYRQAFIDELKEFFAALVQGRPTPVTGIDGLKPILIGLAAKRSLAEHRPVRVSEIES